MLFESLFMFFNTESIFKCFVYYSTLPSWIHNILLLPYILCTYPYYFYCLFIDRTCIIIHVTVFEFLMVLFGVQLA